MRVRRRMRPGHVVPALLVALLACSERSIIEPPPTPPTEPPPENSVLVSCRVVVATQEVSCVDPAKPMLPLGARADLVLGGQDMYVKLTSSGTAYDGGTEIFSTTVTVQNLTEYLMGTADGVSVDGVRIFFQSGPTVTGGTGSVSIANPDGTDTFMAEGQSYFEYAEILQPLQISQEKLWQFSVSSTVTTFTFGVYVSAPMADEAMDMMGAVWMGMVNTDWMESGNWKDGLMPDATLAVSVPPPGMMEPGAQYPVLSSNAAAFNVRVGTGSSLDLNTYQLTAAGNVDATGAISGGHLIMTGSDVLLGGTVPQLDVTGQATLQRPTTATGAVTVTGSLTASTTNPLTIIIP